MTAAVASDATRKRALKALRTGEVTVRLVIWDKASDRAAVVHAAIAGYKGRHDVRLQEGEGWTCTCRDGAAGGCGHALAAKLITGHASVTAVPTAPAADPSPAECRHGMTAEYCADCTGRDGGQAALAAEHAHLLKLPGWTRAGYRGRCCLCGETYEKTDPIRATSQDGRTAWAGPCCGRR